MQNRSHVLVIDPAMKSPELASYNRLAMLSPLPLTYHLPALFGMKSIERVESAIKGIIIFGSLASVNDRHEWQEKLEKWVVPILQKGVPTLGICYGHQMLARLFGGKVGYIFPDQKKLCGFDQSCLVPDRLWDNQKLSGELFVSHCEEVKTCPTDMMVTATRKQIAIDGLAHRYLPIWSFQTHPECTESFVTERCSSSPRDTKKLEFGHYLVQKFLNFVANQ